MAERILYCQRCGTHQIAGAKSEKGESDRLRIVLWPDLKPCLRCDGMTFHREHPGRRDPNWRQPAFIGHDAQALYTLGISPE